MYHPCEIEYLLGLIVLRSQAHVVINNLASGPGPLEHLYADLWHNKQCLRSPYPVGLCIPLCCCPFFSGDDSRIDILVIFHFLLRVLHESHGSIALSGAPSQLRVVIKDQRLILRARL